MEQYLLSSEDKSGQKILYSANLAFEMIKHRKMLGIQYPWIFLGNSFPKLHDNKI